MRPLDRALLSLEGLSLGDALGQCFFQVGDPEAEIRARTLPPAPWYFTDDTEMSFSVVASLVAHGGIDRDWLAVSFARRYSMDRAYGPSMHRVLSRIGEGEHWRDVARESFAGQGSYGNGAAMRAGPIGAWFADDLDATVFNAERASEITHTHPEGIAGAIAVAVATACACAWREAGVRPSHVEVLEAVAARVPASEVRSKLLRARDMEKVRSLDYAISVLGNGERISAQDTVPFALWCVAQNLDDFESAIWLALSAGGDRDTLCAIVGSVVACYVGDAGLPASWIERREELPNWHLGRQR